jgi:predicted GTPase
MKIGAGIVAATKYGAAEFIDPRPWLVGKLRDTFEMYPEIGELLPAMGYGAEQLADLEMTIDAVDCDSVVIGTPIDLSRIITISKPYTRVHYDLQEIGSPDLEQVLGDFATGIELI